MVDVSFHPETEYLFDDVDHDFPGLKEALRDDFKAYIESDFDYRPPRFGKCDLFQWPHSIRGQFIWHIHICLPPSPGFPGGVPQQRLTCQRNNPDRDACLVYVQGLFDEDAYCLLAFMYPDAHGMAQSERFMLWLDRMARDFRENH